MQAFEVLCRAEELGREDAPRWTARVPRRRPLHRQRRAPEERFGDFDGDAGRVRRALALPARQHRQGLGPGASRPGSPPPRHRPRDARAPGRDRRGRRPDRLLRTPRSRSTSARRIPTRGSLESLRLHPLQRRGRAPPSARRSTTPDPGLGRPGGRAPRGLHDRDVRRRVPRRARRVAVRALGQLAVDAPTGAVDFEEEVMTPERFAERQTRSRPWAAPSTRRSRSRPTAPWSRPVHAGGARWARTPTSSSGARSCTASTAATASAWPSRPPTCARCRRVPDKQRIATQNAETNDFMVPSTS